MKAVTIRLSDKLHKAIKYKSIDEEQSIQDYIVKLIKADLKFTDEMDDLSDYINKK